MGITREFSLSKPELRAIYEKLALARGDEGAVLRLHEILRDFYERMARDTMIGFFFEGRDVGAIADRQLEFLLRAMDARTSYAGKPPATAHAALPPILSGHFDRRLVLLEETLRSHELPEPDIQAWLGFENAFRDAVVS